MRFPELRLRQDLTFKNKYDAIAWYYYNAVGPTEVGDIITLDEAKECVARMQKQIDVYEAQLNVD